MSAHKVPIETWFDALEPAENGCLLWTGARSERGYGRYLRAGKMWTAHRAAWEMRYGPIPEGMLVCHSCDNPPCCNTDHLFLGTPADNMHDMMAKGRYVGATGSSHGRAKLDEGKVSVIKKRLANGDGAKAIANDYGVRHSTIWWISTGQHWKNVQAAL